MQFKSNRKSVVLFFAAACFSMPHVGSITKDKNVLNVLGAPLVSCGKAPMTGYYRDGFCATGEEDKGVHVVCAQVTKEFLEFSKAHGNDLISPQNEVGFPGLKPGNRWCLCADRWKEALEQGVAPPVIVEATHQKALQILKLRDLESCPKSPPAH